MYIIGLTVPEMLRLIDAPNRSRCERLWAENYHLFLRATGSSHNHQAWPGGYVDHIQEVMSIAIAQYNFFNKLDSLPFSLSDLLLVLFLHDLEKPWKYDPLACKDEKVIGAKEKKKMNHEFRLKKIAEYGIELTPYQLNGITYVEGEGDDYTPGRRVMNELAALAHICDVASARVRPNYPKVEDRIR
jgi:hypothetical protein